MCTAGNHRSPARERVFERARIAVPGRRSHEPSPGAVDRAAKPPPEQHVFLAQRPLPHGLDVLRQLGQIAGRRHANIV